MGITDMAMRLFAAQLGHPRGVPGRVIGWVLNRRNHGPITGSLAALQVAPGEIVADVGFGGGLSLRLLLEQVGQHGSVYGVDMSATAIADARRRFRGPLRTGRLRLLRASMDRIPLPDSSVDALGTVNTIYYVPDTALAASLGELARILRPGGRLVLGLGDPDYMAELPFSVGVLRLRPVTAIVDALAAAGFTVTAHTRVGTSYRAFHVLTAEHSAGL
ncbi:class I SAM-dependent methyltransferase [Nocardia uniformis]|nr:methyltransferase domain-containing protein [Nocardia uniformis]